MHKKRLSNRIFSLAVAGIFPMTVLAAADHDMGNHVLAAMNGKPGDPAKVDRTVDITVGDDMRYTPSIIDVKAGETIRFFVKNTGKTRHGMMLGNSDELDKHAAMMRDMPDMRHDVPNMIMLNPGQRGAIVWQFTQTGTVDFACTEPGHMEAGMKGRVAVAK